MPTGSIDKTPLLSMVPLLSMMPLFLMGGIAFLSTVSKNTISPHVRKFSRDINVGRWYDLLEAFFDKMKTKKHVVYYRFKNQTQFFVDVD